MRHVNYTLKPTTVDTAKPKDKPYALTDGGGLILEVLPSGSKTWRYKYHLHGKREKVTIGAYPQITIKQARNKHEELRVLVEEGKSPAKAKQVAIAERAAVAGGQRSFKVFAGRWIEETLFYRSESYRSQIVSWLDRIVYPKIGHLDLDEIDPGQILEIIEGMASTAVAAERVRVIIQQIYNYAIRKLIVKTNPATPLRGAISAPPRQHHPHLVGKQIGLFWREVAKQGAHATTVAATRLLFLTMTRKMELLRARWSEFNLDDGTWDIPAERMKLRRVHRVYLARQAVEILREIEKLTRRYDERDVDGSGGYVFPSIFKRSVHMGECTLNHFFGRLDLDGFKFNPHGTRGTAATHLREKRIARDVVELLLAHAVGDETERAYSHMQLPDERRQALQFWADEVERLAAGAEVIALRAA